MKRLIGCIATLVCLALVIGGLVWLVGAKASPAKTLMKEHPYVFETAKAVGDEVQDSFAQGLGCGYVAYPKTKNDQTNETVKQVVDTAKKRFNEYVTQVESMEDYDLIPRVIVDYKTQALDNCTALTMTWRLEEVTAEGSAAPIDGQEVTYYLDGSNGILDLNGLLGEDSEEKINLMLKSSGKTTEDMTTFTVVDDTLTLHWADGKEVLSVAAVQRAGLIDPDKPMLALTFDDGPGRYSRDFADLLTRYGARATFFVLGSNVKNFADDLKYVYEQGNEIASHTMRHKNLNLLSEEGIRTEIDEAAQAIYDAIGTYPTLIRAPYGNANSKVMKVIDGPMIKWSVDTLDWQTRDAQKIKAEILEGAGDGEIILMHEIYKTSLEGLELALKELSDDGYQFVTVSELMQYRGVEPECKHYYNIKK